MPRVPVAARPATPQFLIRNREERGWTQAQAITKLVEAGIALAEGSYPSWETGTRTPSAKTLADIAAFYNAEVPTEPGPPPPVLSDNDRLIAAIASQTVAISELVLELRRVADGQAGQANALAQLATLALDIRGLPGLPSETPPRQGSGGRRSGTALR